MRTPREARIRPPRSFEVEVITGLQEAYTLTARSLCIESIIDSKKLACRLQEACLLTPFRVHQSRLFQVLRLVPGESWIRQHPACLACSDFSSDQFPCPIALGSGQRWIRFPTLQAVDSAGGRVYSSQQSFIRLVVIRVAGGGPTTVLVDSAGNRSCSHPASSRSCQTLLVPC
jgi:hypothetical protein